MKLSIVIPARNEEANIERMTKLLFKNFDPIINKLIIVNDCSNDATRRILQDLSKEKAISDERKNFISQLKEMQLTLSQGKNIFFITSDEDYYATGNKVPFQQGTGYTLMVLYYDSGKIPSQLLAEDFLFEIGSQGYKEIGGKGFGYFWDPQELKSQLKANDLSDNSVIFLNYNSEDRKLYVQNP